MKNFAHQDAYLSAHRDALAHALFWEQGTGKSKPIIDNAVHLYERGEIDCLLVVAPNGVDENWTTDQLPTHLPAHIQRDALIQLYKPEKRTTKYHERELMATLSHKGLVCVAVPYDAFISKRGKLYVWRLLERRRCLYVLDEASAIKTPSAKRTMSIIASGKYARYKRLAEGTPVSVSPFDVYAPVRFLDPEFWKREFDIPTAEVFRNYFGMWQKVTTRDGKDFQKCLGYWHLDQLQAALKKISSRVLKDEVLDLPPKLYNKLYVTMNDEQKRVYKQLKDDFLALLADGQMITAPLVIVQMLRLQQVTCGYVPVDPGPDGEPQPMVLLGKTNPRLDALVGYTQPFTTPGIIWARFRKDIDLICDALGERAVRYDGAVAPEQRQRNKEAFLRGDAQWFVSNPAVAGRGHTLVNAKQVCYYNNSFKLIDRLQSEDRPHRAGQNDSVLYTDITASGTIDIKIVDNLRRKVDLAAQVTGDKLKEWI